MKLKMQYIIPVISLSALLVSCGEKETTTTAPADGNTPAATEEEHDHAHDEVSLGTFSAGDMKIEAAQGHGMVEAGKEGHLVITLPYKDDGATVVRAWIGTEDRTMSAVGKGEYAPSHDDYDIHAIAPTPLPADAKWWVEVEKPDGSKVVGSVVPKM
jgi:hypothetical protein